MNLETTPRDWRIVKLSEIASINPSIDKSKLSDNIDVSFVPMPAVGAGNGNIDVSEIRKFHELKKGYTPFSQGDILFAKITPCMENGKMAVVPPLKNGIGLGSTEFHVLRPYSGINNKFVYYYVSAKSFRLQAERNMSGAVGQRRVPKPFLSECKIPLPPSMEQYRIAIKIEELFSEIDNGIENLKKAQAQLKTYRQAVLKHAFEGKLTEEWRRKNNPEPAVKLLEQIKEERERRYQKQLAKWEEACEQAKKKGKEKPAKPKRPDFYSPLKNDEIPYVAKLPTNWSYEKIGNLCESIVPNRDKPKNFSGNIPWLTTPDIYSDKIVINFDIVKNHLSESEIKRYSARIIPKNSVIMTCVGTFGVTCINHKECVINQQLHAFVTHKYVNPKYLAYALKNQKKHMEKNSTSTTISYLNKTKCNSIPIQVCSVEEQNLIVQEIESRLSVCDNLEQTIENSLQKAEALRQSILKKAFEGKLVPQDSNDEPAEKLLERIKKEKAELKAKAESAKQKSKKRPN